MEIHEEAQASEEAQADSPTEMSFSSEETAVLARLPQRTLANWHASGFFTAPVAAKRRGVSRRYRFRDILALRVVGEVHKAGVSLRRLRKIVEHLREREGLSTSDVLARTTLVASHDRVYEVAGDDKIEIPSGQRVMGYFVVVPLDRIVSELQRNVRALRRAA